MEVNESIAKEGNWTMLLGQVGDMYPALRIIHCQIQLCSSPKILRQKVEIMQCWCILRWLLCYKMLIRVQHRRRTWCSPLVEKSLEVHAMCIQGSPGVAGFEGFAPA